MRVLIALIVLSAALPLQALPLDAYVEALLPRVQEAEELEGRFPLSLLAQGLLLTAPTDDVGRRLAVRLQEALTEAGLEQERASALVEVGEGFHLTSSAPPSSSPTSPTSASSDLSDLSGERRAEAYTLTVTPSALRIAAATERGLLYGIMTLAQLLNAARASNDDALPCMRIIDWPALAMRGPHEDYGRDQLPTIEDHKRSIRIAAQFKANTYFWFIEPDHFVYAFDPEISVEYDRFTFDEIRELVAYAREHYIEVIPVVELLAHMEMTLRHERYQPLSETGQGGGTLCPTSDESFELVRKMIDEIAPAFGARFFHCGLDESQVVGQGRSADAIVEKGVERVYADYYTRMNDTVRKHGQTMIMYADIVLNHPGILDLLPKNIVLMFWGYSPRDHYNGLDTIKASGLPMMALSGLWDWNNLYPVYPPAFKNMEVLAAQASDVGAVGHFVSSWGDGFRGAAGINLSELNHYGFTYCSAVSWNPKPIRMEDYAKAFALSFFGSNTPGLSDALTRLARCQGPDLSHTCQARRLFHSEPVETLLSMVGTGDQPPAFWANLKDEAEQAHKALAKVNPPRNADFLTSIDLVARMLACSADMALTYHEIAAALAQPDFDLARFSEQLRELERRHRALWDEYQRVWRATNRPLNLNHIGRVWVGVSDNLAALAQDIQDGAFPPETKKAALAVFDFDGSGDDVWCERTGTGMTLRAAKGTPEIVEGGPFGDGNCLRLPHGAHLEASDKARLLDFGIAPFLVEAWVRHEGQREQQYGATIFSYGLGGGFRLGIDHKGEVLFTLYGIGEAAGSRSVVPPDGEWHHVAVNFHDCHSVDMYVDGKLTERLDLRGAPRRPSNPLIRVGNEIALVTAFQGDIDHIRVSRGIYGADELDSGAHRLRSPVPFGRTAARD